MGIFKRLKTNISEKNDELFAEDFEEDGDEYSGYRRRRAAAEEPETSSEGMLRKVPPEERGLTATSAADSSDSARAVEKPKAADSSRSFLSNASPEVLSIFTPKKFNDSQLIVDALKRDRAVIVKFDSITFEEAARIYMFVAGSVYALDGEKLKIAEEIYLFVPKNVRVDRAQLADFQHIRDTLSMPWEK